MKDAKQFFSDYTANPALRDKLAEEMNKYSGADMELWQAGQKAALTQGYDIPEAEAKELIDRLQHRGGSDAEELTETELGETAGGTVPPHGGSFCD